MEEQYLYVLIGGMILGAIPVAVLAVLFFNQQREQRELDEALKLEQTLRDQARMWK
jgi:hypothetical protein